MTSTLPPAKTSLDKTPAEIAQRLFFEETGIHKDDVLSWVKKGLSHADDGELFAEYTISESLSLVDGVIRKSSFDTGQGFGLRSVLGEQVNYAHTSSLTADALKGLSSTISSANKGHQGALSLFSSSPQKALYTANNPLGGTTFDQRVSLLKQIDAYTRDLDPRVSQVMARLGASWKVVMIVRPEGHVFYDVRPMSRLNVSVVVSENGRQESGYYGGGGRKDLCFACDPSHWEAMCDEAVRQAIVNLGSISAPAGPMPVVMSNGWGGVLLHEAIGHGLEGDAIRKKTSVYTDKLGQRITMPGVTVVDDGTIPERRGSLTIDDEGTTTQRNVLIEDDLYNARQAYNAAGQAYSHNRTEESRNKRNAALRKYNRLQKEAGTLPSGTPSSKSKTGITAAHIIQELRKLAPGDWLTSKQLRKKLKVGRSSKGGISSDVFHAATKYLQENKQIERKYHNYRLFRASPARTGQVSTTQTDFPLLPPFPQPLQQETLGGFLGHGLPGTDDDFTPPPPPPSMSGPFEGIDDNLEPPSPPPLPVIQQTSSAGRDLSQGALTEEPLVMPPFVDTLAPRTTQTSSARPPLSSDTEEYSPPQQHFIAKSTAARDRMLNTLATSLIRQVFQDNAGTRFLRGQLQEKIDEMGISLERGIFNRAIESLIQSGKIEKTGQGRCTQYKWG
jgi:hypothetical protein